MKRLLAALLSLFLCLLMSGCNAIGLDVENQLRPPKNNGQQEELRMALENFIAQNNERGEVTPYLLKYPSAGQYRSAFLLLDQVQSPVYVSPNDSSPSSYLDTIAEYCLAFYRLDIENSPTHINLLKKSNGSWTSISDVEGYSEEIAQVNFADTTGDSIPELLIGWNLYNAKDKRLCVYSIAPQLTEEAYTDSYTHLTVCDMTGDDVDDLLLFNSDAVAGKCTARLFSHTDGRLALFGTVPLDPAILQFQESTNVIFPNGFRGVYIDAYKDPKTTITELILWNGNQLLSPFYSNELQITSLTAREASLHSCDIDEDGVVEWPLLEMIDQSTSDEQTGVLWKVSWYYFDITTFTAKHDFDSIVNREENYLLQLTDVFPTDFTAKHFDENHLLVLLENDQPFLKIQVTESGKKTDLEEGLVYFDASDSRHYATWYSDSLSISMEEFRYLFTIL